MATKKPSTKKAPKPATETTWKDLTPTERKRMHAMAKGLRRDARMNESEAKRRREHAEQHPKSARFYRRLADIDTRHARRDSALADLIERNL